MDKNELMQMLFEHLREIEMKQRNKGEMLKLIKMLEEANIPFKSSAGQVCYYGKQGPPEPHEGCFYGLGWGAVCSVIYGYGREKGLLEISGLMTDEEYEKENNSVLGYLTAENVFARIKKHWESEQ